MNNAIREALQAIGYFILGSITGGLIFGLLTYLQYKGA